MWPSSIGELQVVAKENEGIGLLKYNSLGGYHTYLRGTYVSSKVRYE
jgi:hypothetical protein